MRKNTISTNLILIAALLAMLCGCGKKEDETYNPRPLSTKSKGSPLVLDFNDTDIGKQIIKDYVKYLYDGCNHPLYCSDSNQQLLVSNLFIKVYYGIYNGYIPVAIASKCDYVSCSEDGTEYVRIGDEHLQMASIIDDIRFDYKRRKDEIFVWEGGHIYRLGEAYYHGWLTYEDLRKIADYHEFIYESEDML